MPYPSGQPAWQQQELDRLSAAGLLSGINPLVLSGIGQNESGWEVAGPGINSSGYGGFYGLGQNSSYSFGSSSFTESPGILMDPGVSSFDQQSEAAAAEVAHLMQGSGSLQGALAEYTGGGPTNGDYTLAVQYLAGESPTLSGASYPVTGGGGAAPAGGATPTATTAAFGGSLNPANWPGELINAIKPWTARIILVIVALLLLKVGLDHLMDTDNTPAGIIASSVPSGGASKSVSAPGTGQQSAPVQQTNTHEQPPKQHKVRDTAEHAGEAAAVA